MKESISKRLMVYFILLIVITVLILETALMVGVRRHLYLNVEENLKRKIELTTEFYHRYFATYMLDDLLVDDVDVLWRQVDTQVQVLDPKGMLMMDSIGYTSDTPIQTGDVIAALRGETGSWIGREEYSSSRLMAVSAPLMNEGHMIGVLRLVASLDEVDASIRQMAAAFVWAGIFVVGLAILLSRALAHSIVSPVLSLTKVAQKMADGQFQVRSDIEQPDEIGQLASTLNLMVDEIVKREQIKNDFISSVSHELRTPLTSIKGWAITLEDGTEDDPELLAEGLSIIKDEADRLEEMVEELLDFSRFIGGRIHLEKRVFSLDELLKTTYRQMLPRAKNEGLDMQLVTGRPLGNYVGDENRIRQVLINLIDNSIKFTPAGKPIFLKSYTSEDELVLEVEDHGLGISADDLPRVKEKFYKGKHAGSKNGIGLSLADEIVKLHGGRLEVESEEGVYTKMRVFLPKQEITS